MGRAHDTPHNLAVPGTWPITPYRKNKKTLSTSLLRACSRRGSLLSSDRAAKLTTLIGRTYEIVIRETLLGSYS